MNHKYYLVDSSKNSLGEMNISINDEISKSEIDDLMISFVISPIYWSINQIKDIVVQNGISFQNYVSEANLKAMRIAKTNSSDIVLNANRLVLNYATSIKTYIDMETRILKKNSKQKGLEIFKNLCSRFYDDKIEYRFWMNFRNYIIHCEFPFHGFVESFDDGTQIICTKERLLKFDNWKHSKQDILDMDEINLPNMVNEMSASILALYIDFFANFGNEITKGISMYGEFCRKHNVKKPMFLKADGKFSKENFEQILYKSNLQPLPVDDLMNAFNVLKDNPKVIINLA